MISVIIPTLDESGCIERTLRRTLAQEGALELIVADGGSRDDTVARAGRLTRVVESAPGRGVQMNRGARDAAGEILLFLHADTLLPDGALALVEETMKDPGLAGGRFSVRYDREHWVLKLITAYTRAPWVPFWFGDQTIFVRRSLFHDLGGFQAIPLMEDLDFGRRLRQSGRTVVIDRPVISSARRFNEKGPVRTTVTMALIFCLYFLGVPPGRLATLYRTVR